MSYAQNLLKNAAPFLLVRVQISTQAQSPVWWASKRAHTMEIGVDEVFLVRYAKECTTLPFKPTEIQGRLWFGSTSPCKPVLYCWWDTSTIKKYIVHLSVCEAGLWWASQWKHFIGALSVQHALAVVLSHSTLIPHLHLCELIPGFYTQALWSMWVPLFKEHSGLRGFREFFLCRLLFICHFYSAVYV